MHQTMTMVDTRLPSVVGCVQRHDMITEDLEMNDDHVRFSLSPVSSNGPICAFGTAFSSDYQKFRLPVPRGDLHVHVISIIWTISQSVFLCSRWVS